VNGTLYITLDTGEMTAIDPESYQEVWTFPREREFACGAEEPRDRELDGIYGAPAVNQDTLFVGAWDGAAYAVNRADGACLWRFLTDEPIIGGTVLGDAGLYVPSTDGILYVLDPATGEETASFAVGEVWSTPWLTEDESALYVATMEGRLWALDPETLDRIWDAPFEVSTGLLTDPVLAGDVVIVGGLGETLYGVNAATGEEAWSVGGANWFWGRPFVDETTATVYATTMAGEVIAIDAATGDVIWEAGTESPVRAGPVVAADVLVAVDKKGAVYRLDLETGAHVGDASEIEKQVLADVTLLEDGLVLIVADNGDVYEYDAEQGRTARVIN